MCVCVVCGSECLLGKRYGLFFSLLGFCDTPLCVGAIVIVRQKSRAEEHPMTCRLGEENRPRGRFSQCLRPQLVSVSIHFHPITFFWMDPLVAASSIRSFWTVGSLLSCQSCQVLRALHALLFLYKMQAGTFAEYLWHFIWEG